MSTQVSPRIEAPTLAVAFPPQWEWVRRIRTQVATLLANEPRDFAQPTVKAASELVENAVKYSQFDAKQQCAFTLTIERGWVTVSVAHVPAPEYPYDTLARQVEAIRKAPNKTALYEARILDLAQSSGTGSRLGLLWIASEGGFDLQCTHERGLLKMVAKRRIS